MQRHFQGRKVGAGLALVIATQAAAAGETPLTVVSGIDISYKSTEFLISGKQFDPRFTTLNLMLTGAYGRFYSTVNFDQSIKDDVQYDLSSTSGGGSDDFAAIFSREDYGVTLGYNVWRGLTLFGGYKFGKTTANLLSSATPGQTPNMSLSFEEQGLFAGINYARSFSDKGTLGLNVGYADMDGEIKNSREAFLNGKGDTQGFSYGLSWTGPLSETAVYTLGLKFTRYEFDQNNALDPQEDLSFDEDFNVLSVGVANYF